ncbi:MAG TPA: DUF2267 domain-containing protein [Azospirillaceae bacterium]|nr:DUF2267 domain-containing protein [Azospirillaceae bacterium]
MDRVAVFSSTLQETDQWLHAVMDELGTDNINTAYTALRSVLHEVRDRIPADAAVHVGTQLPMLIRGLYYEGWKPSKPPTQERTLAKFLDGVRNHARGHDELDPEKACRAVFGVLSSRIAPGEAVQARQLLPAEILPLWPAPGSGLGQAADAMRRAEGTPSGEAPPEAIPQPIGTGQAR